MSFKIDEGRTFELIERSDDPEYNRVRFQVGFEVENIESAREQLIRRGVEPIDIDFWVARRRWRNARSRDGSRIYGKELEEGATCDIPEGTTR